MFTTYQFSLTQWHIKTLLLVVLAFGFQGSVAQVNLNDGLIIHLPFNGNANDESGNGNDGTVNGATLTADRHGNPNSAYSFDGIDDGISSTDLPISDGDISVVSWIKISESISNRQYNILSKRSICNNTSAFLDINYTASDKTLVIETTGNASNTGTIVYPMENYNWVMMTFVKSDAFKSNKLYINEELVYEQAWTSTSIDLSNDDLLTIGGLGNPCGNREFLGDLDDIRIYNRAINFDEIKELFDMDIEAPTALTAMNSESDIVLSWEDNSSTELGFIIERSETDANNFVEIGRVGANVVNYVDGNVDIGMEYFYRIVAYNSSLNSEYSNTDSILIEPWQDIVGGGVNHIIEIPNTLISNIDGNPIEIGDYIGVFFTDKNGDLQSSSSRPWEGSTTTLTPWNSSGGVQKNGFDPEEEFIIKVWKTALQKEFVIRETVYDENLPFTQQGFYILNGLSGLIEIGTNTAPIGIDDILETKESTLVNFNVMANDSDPESDSIGTILNIDASNGITTLDDDGIGSYLPNAGFIGLDSFSYKVCDAKGLCDSAWVRISVIPRTSTIKLDKGWNLISSYITPSDSLLNNFFPNNTSLVKNSIGEVLYLPNNGLDNGKWSGMESYKVFMEESDSVIFSGSKIDPQTSFDLPVRNVPLFIPYLGENEAVFEDVFSSVKSSISLAITWESNGGSTPTVKVFQPDYDISQIGTAKPGAGYMVIMNTSVEDFSYPAGLVNRNTKDISSSRVKTINPEYFDNVRVGEGNFSIIVVPEKNIEGIEYGNEIGVFTKNGVLVGASVYQKESMAIVVWGYGGMKNGEEFLVKVYDTETEKELKTTVKFKKGQNTFSAFETREITSFKVGEITSSFSVYPNPAKQKLNFSFGLKEDSFVELSIFDVLGKKVHQFKAEKMHMGNQLLKTDVSNLAKGQYIYQLNINGKMNSNKVIIE